MPARKIVLPYSTCSMQNKKYLQEWNAVSGIQQGASFARDRYWQLYKIAIQLQTVIGGK